MVAWNELCWVITHKGWFVVDWEFELNSNCCNFHASLSRKLQISELHWLLAIHQPHYTGIHTKFRMWCIPFYSFQQQIHKVLQTTLSLMDWFVFLRYMIVHGGTVPCHLYIHWLHSNVCFLSQRGFFKHYLVSLLCYYFSLFWRQWEPTFCDAGVSWRVHQSINCIDFLIRCILTPLIKKQQQICFSMQ